MITNCSSVDRHLVKPLGLPDSAESPATFPATNSEENVVVDVIQSPPFAVFQTTKHEHPGRNKSQRGRIITGWFRFLWENNRVFDFQ